MSGLQFFEEIPLDTSMFAIFERDKANFTNAIRGSGFEEGSKRQGLLLHQVRYYRAFCLPRPVVLADPFHLFSGRFRSRMPEALPQGRRQQRAVVERDEEEEEDWEGLDADAEEMVKVVRHRKTLVGKFAL